MNLWPMLRADLSALRWTAAAIVALISVAVALTVATNLIERGLRQASAKAADDFDIVIGAPGSQTQLLLSAVYLQLEVLPLVDGDVLARLRADRRVRAAAPIAFGDAADGYPIIGTTPEFALRWGRLTLSDGRMFANGREAIVGAAVDLALGAPFSPVHAEAGLAQRPGHGHADSGGEVHADIVYRVVGRLPRLNSPWDRAILVPVESVWEVHGLWPRVLAEAQPGVPAIVVKPAGVAEAYSLRSDYRRGGTMAIFPAEVLVSLYGAVGDAQGAILALAILNGALTFSAILLLLWTIAGLRARRYAVLRALGAPQAYVLSLVWLNAVTLLVAGAALGVMLGAALTALLGGYFARETGLSVPVTLMGSDLALVGLIVLYGAALSILPAFIASRSPPIQGLRLDR